MSDRCGALYPDIPDEYEKFPHLRRQCVLQDGHKGLHRDRANEELAVWWGQPIKDRIAELLEWAASECEGNQRDQGATPEYRKGWNDGCCACADILRKGDGK